MSRSERYIPALGYAALTRFFDRVLPFVAREQVFKQRLIEQADIKPAHRVLDLACGTGTLLVRIARCVPGADLAGLDADIRMLNTALRKKEAEGCLLALHCGISMALPYRDGAFDRVVSSLFFHHLRRDAKCRTLIEVRRVLTPGGWLHIADWGRPKNFAMRTVFLGTQLLDGFESTRDSVAGVLPELMVAAGFEDVAVRTELSTIAGTLTFYSARRP